MTLLNLVQPVSRGQSQYLLQALSAHSSYRFSIDTSQGIQNYIEGGEKIFFRQILLRTSVMVCIPHFCTIPRTAVALSLLDCIIALICSPFQGVAINVFIAYSFYMACCIENMKEATIT